MRVLTKKEKQYLDSIVNQIEDQEVKEYILADFDTQLDIVEQQLDAEEAFLLVSGSMSIGHTPSTKESFPGLSYKTKTISLRLTPFHIDALKEKSAKT